MRRHDKKVFFLASERGSSREKKARAAPPVFFTPASQSCAAEAPCFAMSKAPVSIPGNGR